MRKIYDLEPGTFFIIDGNADYPKYKTPHGFYCIYSKTFEFGAVVCNQEVDEVSFAWFKSRYGFTRNETSIWMNDTEERALQAFRKILADEKV